MNPHYIAIFLVFALFSSSSNAASKQQAAELARCFVHEIFCDDKVAKALSDSGSPALEKSVLRGIESEIKALPPKNRNWPIRQLLDLKTEGAYALFWKSVRGLELDFEKLQEDLEAGIVAFSNDFQHYTATQIEKHRDFELASIYFDLFYFYEYSDWSDLDKYVDRVWALYVKVHKAGELKPEDTALIKHMILENSANQLDKEETDYHRLRKMWEVAQTLDAEPISAYEKLVGNEVDYSWRGESFQHVGQYYREFSDPTEGGKRPRIFEMPIIFYQIRTEKEFLNRLWSDSQGNSLLVGVDGEFYAFDGHSLFGANEVWKIYDFSLDIADSDESEGLFGRFLNMKSESVESKKYNKISYLKLSNVPGEANREIFVNHALPVERGYANYVEIAQKGSLILLSMDLPTVDSEISVKQFVFEFNSEKYALEAFDSLSTRTPTELKKTSLWYHSYDDENQGLIVRTYTNEEGDDITISPYKQSEESLEFSNWDGCKRPFSAKSLHGNASEYLLEESRLYRKGYRLKYFNLTPECTVEMPWDSEKDVVKRIIAGLEHYDKKEGAKQLKDHAVKTRPYSFAPLDISDENHLAYSRIGGNPSIPKKFENAFVWPEYKKGDKTYPLRFLLQIDFSELNNPRWNTELPDSGLLSIFYYLQDGWKPYYAKGYYFQQPEQLIRVSSEGRYKDNSRAPKWEPQRILFSKELVDQYPIREWADPYDRFNIINKIDEDTIQQYYDKTYGVGAYSKDPRPYHAADLDHPVFMQIPMHEEETLVYLNLRDFEKQAENGVLIIGVNLDWVGHYD